MQPDKLSNERSQGRKVECRDARAKGHPRARVKTRARNRQTRVKNERDNEWKKKSIKRTRCGLAYSCRRQRECQERLSMRLVEEETEGRCRLKLHGMQVLGE